MKISLSTPSFIILIAAILAVFLSMPVKAKKDTKQAALDAFQNIESRAAERKAKYDAARHEENYNVYQDVRANPFGGKS